MDTHTENITPATQEIIDSFKALERSAVTETWFHSWSDAINRFNDLFMEAYWRYFADTSNEEVKAKFQALQRHAKPQVEQSEQTLTAKAVAFETEDETLSRIIAKQRLSKTTHTPANVPLEARVEELTTKYSTLTSQQMVSVDDDKLTPTELNAQLRREQNRAKREQLWLQLEARKKEDAGEIDALFLEATELRQAMAKNVGLSYREFCWRAKHRTDYTPDDSLRLLDYVDEIFAPTQHRHAQQLASSLDVDELRPWDLEVTQSERVSTRKLSEEAYLEALKAAFHKISPTFGAAVDAMIARNHIDLMSRPNKAPRNFSTLLTTHDEPLVFCSASGDINDLRVMLHECGHAVHFSFSSPGKLFFEKVPPIEMCEFAAYTFQTLGSETLRKSGYLRADEASHFRKNELDTMLSKVRSYARVERFQHWLYSTTTTPTTDDMDATWLNLRPDPLVNWQGLTSFQKKGWHHSHIIRNPFYSIDYIIAWIGTLLFLNRFQKNRAEASKQFATALSFGNTKGLTESFTALGIQFPFRKHDVVEAHDSFLREFAESIAA